MKREKEKVVCLNLRISQKEADKITRISKRQFRSKNATIRYMIQSAKG